jgi:hypothetical protein
MGPRAAAPGGGGRLIPGHKGHKAIRYPGEAYRRRARGLAGTGMLREENPPSDKQPEKAGRQGKRSQWRGEGRSRIISPARWQRAIPEMSRVRRGEPF